MHFNDALLFSNSITLLCQKCSKFGNFQNGKNGIFFLRQQILREAQSKNKTKKESQETATISSVKNIQLELFYIKKINPKKVRANVFSCLPEVPQKRLRTFVGVFFFFLNVCQKSPNCRKNISRPVMNSPGIAQATTRNIYKKNKKFQQACLEKAYPP